MTQYFQKKPLHIVEEIPGEGTGEVIYRTEDGELWIKGVPDNSQTCPQQGGKIVDGYIFRD